MGTKPNMPDMVGGASWSAAPAVEFGRHGGRRAAVHEPVLLLRFASHRVLQHGLALSALSIHTGDSGLVNAVASCGSRPLVRPKEATVVPTPCPQYAVVLLRADAGCPLQMAEARPMQGQGAAGLQGREQQLSFRCCRRMAPRSWTSSGLGVPCPGCSSSRLPPWPDGEIQQCAAGSPTRKPSAQRVAPASPAKQHGGGHEPDGQRASAGGWGADCFSVLD
uniref:Uncharacterized protein n=1 Tax=Aegilops tauschii TaxID=37682 RepID=N1R1X3_AEGTA